MPSAYVHCNLCNGEHERDDDGVLIDRCAGLERRRADRYLSCIKKLNGMLETEKRKNRGTVRLVFRDRTARELVAELVELCEWTVEGLKVVGAAAVLIAVASIMIGGLK